MGSMVLCVVESSRVPPSLESSPFYLIPHNRLAIYSGITSEIPNHDWHGLEFLKLMARFGFDDHQNPSACLLEIVRISYCALTCIGSIDRFLLEGYNNIMSKQNSGKL